MNTYPLEVTVNLTNQKMQFSGVSKSQTDRPIVFDYPPPLGDGQGYRGLELFLLSFAGCVSTTIVYVLRKMGKDIAGLTMQATGITRNQPLSLQKIALDVILTSKDADTSDLQSAIKQAEELSPVWILCKQSVEVNTGYKLIKTEAP